MTTVMPGLSSRPDSMGTGGMYREIAKYVTRAAPKGENNLQWNH
jgi:hypothetical protein